MRQPEVTRLWAYVSDKLSGIFAELSTSSSRADFRLGERRDRPKFEALENVIVLFSFMHDQTAECYV
jgi:hypothetical protein